MDDGAHRFRALDGLRGLAALIVVAQHFVSVFIPSAVGSAIPALAYTQWWSHIEQTPFNVLLSGNLAVCVFFVLSGFVLSAAFWRTGHRSTLIRTGAARYPRLMLPALGSILVVYIAFKFGWVHNVAAAELTGSAGWLAQLWPYPPTFYWAIVCGVWGIFFHPVNFWGLNPWGVLWNVSLWTMEIELLGSFLLVAMLLVMGKWRQQWRWLAYAGLAIGFAQSYYLAIILGIVLSDVYHHHRSQLAKWRPWVAVALIPGAILACWQHPVYYHNWYGAIKLPGWGTIDMQMLAHVLAAAIILTAVLTWQAPQRWLQTRPLQWLGRHSFAIYLLHIPVIAILGADLYLWWRPMFGSVWSVVAVLPVVLGVLAVVAPIYSRWVDQPAIRLSRVVGRTAERWWQDRFNRPSAN